MFTIFAKYFKLNWLVTLKTSYGDYPLRHLMAISHDNISLYRLLYILINRIPRCLPGARVHAEAIFSERSLREYHVGLPRDGNSFINTVMKINKVISWFSIYTYM